MRYMSVEDKQAGQGLITTLNRKNQIPIKAVQRGAEQNKWARHCNTQPFIKRKKVFIPKLHNEEGEKLDHVTWFNGDYGYSNDWVIPWLAEMESITVGVLADVEDGHDDQYDTLMDAVQDMQINGQSALASALEKRLKRRKNA